MIIIGIYDGHNSSACLTVSGKIIEIAEEERITRIKNDSGFPLESLSYLKSKYKDEFKKIDYVALAGTQAGDIKDLLTKRYPTYGIKDFLVEEERFWIKKLNNQNVSYLDTMREYISPSNSHYNLKDIKENFSNKKLIDIRKKKILEILNIDIKKIKIVDHHTCHASYAYFSSGIKDPLIVTMDGFGDNTNATISIVENERIKFLYRTNLCNLGRIYHFITLLLGMKPEQDEFKVMGLAGYAKDYQIKDALKIFESTYGLNDLHFIKKIEINNHYQYFKKKLEGYRFDIIAGALQKFLENITSEWLARWLKKTKKNNIVFSGGISLNIKLSQEILKIKKVKNLAIPPGGGDNSLSVGAAQFLNYKKNGINSNVALNNAYLGKNIPEKSKLAFSKHEIIKKKFICKKNTSLKVIAKLISQGKIFAFINSNSEFGPRALGHRSFLCDPRHTSIIQEINYRIKNRDFWMPFACSILDYRTNDYLLNTKDVKQKYMTMSFNTKKQAQIDLKAGIHQVDKTIRPQVVYKNDCKDYYKLIEYFQEYTGVGGLLNTSLNTHGKPIINDPMDLIKEMLLKNNVLIDYIYIQGDMYVRKDKNK